MTGVHIISDWRKGLVRDAYEKFEIGNHSFSHPWETKDTIPYYNGPPSVVRDDFHQNDIKLSDTLNLSSPEKFIHARLPTKDTWRLSDITKTDGSGGAAADLLSQNGYMIYGWDKEWNRDNGRPRESPDEIFEKVKSALENGNTKRKDTIIVLMHDSMFKESRLFGNSC